MAAVPSPMIAVSSPMIAGSSPMIVGPSPVLSHEYASMEVQKPLGFDSVPARCPVSYYVLPTRVVYQTGWTTYLACCMGFLTAPCYCLCAVPFFLDEVKDARHYC